MLSVIYFCLSGVVSPSVRLILNGFVTIVCVKDCVLTWYLEHLPVCKEISSPRTVDILN